MPPAPGAGQALGLSFRYLGRRGIEQSERATSPENAWATNDSRTALVVLGALSIGTIHDNVVITSAEGTPADPITITGAEAPPGSPAVVNGGNDGSQVFIIGDSGPIAAPDDGGYELVGADGGVYAFGVGAFLGSMSGRVTAPAVGAVPV